MSQAIGGLVGSAILKNLKAKGYTNFVLRTHAELDLTDQQAVHDFFAAEKPEYVFLSAAHVGGIMANSRYRADFIYENLMIQNNVIHASYLNKVKKLLFLGSTCIYPGNALQPMPEDCLLTSPLEYTNEPYAIAKIAGIKMCESYNLQYGTNYIAVMPTNLYGPNDNFNLETSHVLPAMIRKVHLGKCLSEGDWDSVRKDLSARPVENVSGDASESEISDILAKYGIYPGKVELWGTGKPLREFLLERGDGRCFRLCDGEGRFLPMSVLLPAIFGIRILILVPERNFSIREVAFLIREKVGFTGEIVFNSSKPDGTMRKLTDVTKLHALGWHHTIEVDEGIERLYCWYLEN